MGTNNYLFYDPLKLIPLLSEELKGFFLTVHVMYKCYNCAKLPIVMVTNRILACKSWKNVFSIDFFYQKCECVYKTLVL